MSKGKTNSGTGGGSRKSSIIVTAPTGSTVCIENQDGKRKDATEKNGVWTFRGCDVGVWIVNATLGEQSATKTVEITEEDQRMRYYVAVTYFAATITVTYPAGSVCTCTKDSTVLTAPNTSGNVEFTVPEAGEWLVNCTDGAQTANHTVFVEVDGQSESITLLYQIILLSGITGQSNFNLSGHAQNKDEGFYFAPGGNWGCVTTKTSYDLASFNTITCVIQVISNANHQFIAGVTSKESFDSEPKDSDFITFLKNRNDYTQAGTYTVEADISNVTSGHICICSNWDNKVYVKQIILS